MSGVNFHRHATIYRIPYCILLGFSLSNEKLHVGQNLNPRTTACMAPMFQSSDCSPLSTRSHSQKLHVLQ